MNLSILARSFDLSGTWQRVLEAEPEPKAAPAGLTDLQRKLVLLHVAQATPIRPSDSRPHWPGIAIVCSLMVALFAFGASAFQ